MTVNAIDGILLSTLTAINGKTLSGLSAINGQTVAAGGCAFGVDISNGWCYVAHTTAGSSDTTSVTTGTITTTGADLIVIVVSYFGDNGHLANTDVSDSKGNSWSTAVDSFATQSNLIVYSKPTTVGTLHTFTVSNVEVTYPTITVIAVSGSHATPLDQTNSTSNGSGTSTATGSITPSANNCLVISGWTLLTNTSGNTPTINSSMTVSDFTENDGSTHQSGAAAYVTQSTAAAINPTWSWVNSAGNVGSIVSFKHS